MAAWVTWLWGEKENRVKERESDSSREFSVDNGSITGSRSSRITLHALKDSFTIYPPHPTSRMPYSLHSPMTSEYAASAAATLTGSHPLGEQNTFSDSFIREYPLNDHIRYDFLLYLFFACNAWTLFMTVLPVLVDLPPNNYYAGHPDWFTGNDFMRFLEPFGGIPLNFFALYYSGCFERFTMSSEKRWIVSIFLLGICLYGQGSGFHSASNMYKNAVETLPQYGESEEIADLHYYMRTVWQHDISHYMYASGVGLMYLSQLIAYRDLHGPTDGLSLKCKCILTTSGLTFGVLLGLVAIDFPQGSIVGMVIAIGGIISMLWYLFGDVMLMEDKSGFSFGGRPICHHFMLGFIVALIIIICWVSVVGFKTRTQVF